MGCLEFLLRIIEVLFGNAIVNIFCPWLSPDPGECVNLRLYALLTLVTGITSICCNLHHPVDGTLSFIGGLSFLLCIYFAVLTFCYLPKTR